MNKYVIRTQKPAGIRQRWYFPKYAEAIEFCRDNLLKKSQIKKNK